ncbi:MAG: 1-phosphofructokinase [Anaerolineae bacterium]
MIYTVTLNPSLDRTLYFNNLKIGEVNRADLVQINLGGKGVNVSIALANLGLPSVLTGFAGGPTGDLFIKELEKRGFRCAFTRTAGEMRSNITVVDRALMQTTKLNEPGPLVTRSEIDQIKQFLLKSLQTGDLVVFSGSLPPGAPANTYAEMIQFAKERGAHTALDTSGEALQLGCQAKPDWIKPNCEEAQALTGLEVTQESWMAALGKMKDFGVQYIVLSAGERGIVFTGREHAWHAIPPQIAVNSTVGAGDAALASALFAWLSHQNEEDIARWAAAAGTAAVGLDGSDMPTLDQILIVYNKTRTKLLN